MKETSENLIIEHIAKHREFFATQQTKDVEFRLTQLRKLKKIILENQEKIEQALWEDLH